jgi:hypothetical protein
MWILRNLLVTAASLPLATAAMAQDPTPIPSTGQPAAQATPAPTATNSTAPADPATAQPAAAEPDDEYGEEQAIVITGQKPRGSVEGDITPEQVLTSRDVRATGAINITELLDALAPQIGSSQGRGGERPVLLLNGKKISGFRELRDIPTEAIERVDILPEEVALKYGYGANQKVVNIVLRERFRSTAVAASATAGTEGGYTGGNGDVTRLMINRDGRSTFNLHAEGNGILTENERDIALEVPSLPGSLAARSLLGSKRLYRGSGTINRTIWGDVSASLNGEVEHDEGRSLFGLGTALLEPLARRTRSDSGRGGFVLNGNKANWQWSLVGNGELTQSSTKSDRDDLIFDLDKTRQTSTTGDLTATANGHLFKLPAGDAGATFTVETDTAHLHSERDRLGDEDRSNLSRTEGRAAVNIDLPISRRNKDFSALGNLTLSGNAEVSRLSDFGTLTKYGANVFASPVNHLNLLASWSREEGAPSIGDLGDPILETPDSRIFDFTTGQTVLATVITGGNRDLASDRRTVTKLSANWQPLETPSLRLRADYVRGRTDQPVRSIFGPTATIEAAFPERFVRDSTGRLVSADLRPINFDEARKDTLRFGLDFTKSLKSRRPSQSVIDQLRAQFRRDRAGSNDAPPPPSPDGAAPPPPDAAGPPPPDVGGGRRFGGGRGGGLFGGGSRGRLTLSLTDTITLKDRVSIGPGLPILDYLNGEASGAGGGTPRHKIESQVGWANNGFGVRLSGNWQSGTRVQSRVGEDLRFSPLATLDLRAFFNPGDRPELMVEHPWLRGASARFEIKNLFDIKPKVHDASGLVPINYQPDLLDPLGRTVMFTLRKLFAPSPSTIRREFERERSAR